MQNKQLEQKTTPEGYDLFIEQRIDVNSDVNGITHLYIFGQIL